MREMLQDMRQILQDVGKDARDAGSDGQDAASHEPGAARDAGSALPQRDAGSALPPAGDIVSQCTRNACVWHQGSNTSWHRARGMPQTSPLLAESLAA